ncbi:Tma64p [Sporobolomyces salmoneus]|uniref:Tma64p n=1 Tax=Sporobolomyces salmoneus TaxID=183962 RepID=UPI0031784700
MFKRPYTSKTTTPIRSSDLRKLRSELSELFLLSKDSLKLLLPDGSLSGKATTHLDEPVTIYYASPSGGENGTTMTDPRFFRIGKGNEGLLVPTIYTFNLLMGEGNTLLPRLETAREVVENLTSGSALFTAGVSQRSLQALPETLKQGDLVAVVVYNEPERVVAVGQLASGKEELLKNSEDRKGKAVITLHARGDHLWESGSKTVPSVASSTSTSTSSAPAPAAPSQAQTDSLSSQLASTSLSAPSSSSEPSSAELTPTQVDQILHTSLLLSISVLPSSSYPLPLSSFYSSHVLPSRPASPPSHSTVDLKKSSYKKLSGLIKYAVKRGWVSAKEVRGEWIVINGNREHEDVANVRSYRTVGMAEAAAEKEKNNAETTSTGGETTAATGGGGEAGGRVTVNEYYKPSSSSLKQFLSLLPSSTHPKPSCDLYSYGTIKSLFLSYLTSHHLVHQNSQKHFLLVPSTSLSLEDLSHQELLVNLLLRKGESVTEWKEGVMTKDEGFKRIVSNSGLWTEYWGFSRGGGSKGEEESVQKGKPPVIKVAIKNVGKRQVTLISGHEGWNDLVKTEELAEDLKHKSASSVSIQPLAGSAKKHQTPKVEIMCQGTHDKLIMTLLTQKFGVPKRFIEVDMSKSKK